VTTREAAQLVLQAGSLAEAAGAIAMLEMGEPVRILELAEKMIRFSGRIPGKDIPIVFTGLRPGEKLTEELVLALEASVPTSAEKIRISQTIEGAGPDLVQDLSRLLGCLNGGDRGGTLATLCELVPECVPPLQLYSSTQSFSSPVRPAEPWNSAIEPLVWRERRRASVRSVEPPDLSLSDRRNGVICRRKTPRVGGRRGTDTGALLPTARPASGSGSQS
jgi:hypothetical protein